MSVLGQAVRYWCPKCQQWFPADVCAGGVHTFVTRRTTPGGQEAIQRTEHVVVHEHLK